MILDSMFYITLVKKYIKEKIAMKKNISVFLILLLIFNCSVIGFAADEKQLNHIQANSYTIKGGAREATPEQIAEAEADFDPHRFDYLKKLPAEKATWYALGVTYYGQETSMSCGPASVRMVLKYKTGTTYAESTIRNNTNYSATWGTSLADLVSYTNSQQNYSYTKYYGSSSSYILDGILSAIRYSSAPPICGLKEKSAWGFPYNGDGSHFVVIHQVTSDKSKVAVFDPWAGYIGDTGNKTYDVTANNLMNAYCASYCGIAF